MAPDESVPTLEASTHALVQAVRALRMDLGPTQGLTIGMFPPEFQDVLLGIAVPTQAVANLAGKTLTHVASQAKSLLGIGKLLQEHIKWVEERVGDPFVDYIHGWLTTYAEQWTAKVTHFLEIIGNNILELHVDLEAMTQTIRGTVDGLSRTVSRMSKSMEEALKDVKLEASIELEVDWAALLEQFKEVLPQMLGDAPHVGKGMTGFLGAHAVESTILATQKILSDTETRSPGILGWVMDLIQAGLKGVQSVITTVFQALQAVQGGMGRTMDGFHDPLGSAAGALMLGPFTALSGGGPAKPERAWSYCVGMYGWATAMGMMAQGIAAIGKMQIFGSGGIDLGGLARVFGTLGGLNSLAGQIQGAIHYAYIGKPLRYWIDSFARPLLPSMGDLLRFKYKRIFDPPPYLKSPPRPPYTFQECIAFAGYSDEWIKVYEDDLYREPMARDLLMMAEVVTPEKGWWEYKISRLGYDPKDAPLMVTAYKRRAARSQIAKLYQGWYELLRRGFVTPAEFKKGVAKTRYCDMAIEFGLLAAETQGTLDEKSELLTFAIENYTRDVLDDDGFRSMLGEVFGDQRRADRRFKLEKVKRTRKIYRLTPAEEVRKALPLYKKSFLTGRMTKHEYEAKLLEAGLEGDALDLRLSFDEEERDRKMLEAFRKNRLPDLRDEFLHGLIDLAGFRGELGKTDMQTDEITGEVALVQEQMRRRIEREVLTGQLPAYRQAFVLGLIDADLLDGAFEDAGVPEPKQAAEHLLLDFRREERIRLAEERRADEEARAKAQEERERDRRATVAKRAREKAIRDAQRRAKAVAADAAKRAREATAQEKSRMADVAKREREREREIADVERVAGLARRPPWLRDVAGLRSRLDRAYAEFDELLPDDVHSLASDLEDVIDGPDAPDPIRVDSLIGRIDMALARHAGIIPTPDVGAP